MWRGMEREDEFRRLVLGSSLQAAVFQTAYITWQQFADVPLQSSCPINSIQHRRKPLFSGAQLESKHKPNGE